LGRDLSPANRPLSAGDGRVRRFARTGWPVHDDISGQYVPILMVIARHERTRLQTFYLNSMHGNP
jgi:hypothetical protein